MKTINTVGEMIKMLKQFDKKMIIGISNDWSYFKISQVVGDNDEVMIISSDLEDYLAENDYS